MSRGAGGGSGAFGAAAASSSSSSPAIGSSYQSADRLYMTTCENIEKELRKLTANMAAARKQVEQVGTAKDTEDLRKKLCVHARGADEAPREAGGRPRAAGIAPGVRARTRRAREDRGYPAARARQERARPPPPRPPLNPPPPLPPLPHPARRTANLEKGKESVKGISGMLKSELGPSVEASDLSAKERSDRKMQQTRYQKDFKDAMAAFQDVRVSL
jgi:hypothetical protein